MRRSNRYGLRFRCGWLLGLFAMASSGCSVIGYGVGASTPSYKTRTTIQAVRPGTKVRIRYTDVANQPDEVVGTYERATPEVIEVKTPDAVLVIPHRQVTGVEAEAGNYALEGTLVGFAIDTAAIVVILVVTNPKGTTHSGSGSFTCTSAPGGGCRW